MILVFLALMMGLGVIFGMQALVVDLGYGMAEHGAMQNAADAGALAAARLMAGAVSTDASGKAMYALTDSEVHQRAVELATPNFVGSLSSSNHAVAVEYLACPGQADGRPNFTAQSDAGLVADLVTSNAAPTGSTKLAAGRANDIGVGSAPNWSWSSPICMVRVWVRESHGAMLARGLAPPSTSPEQELAKATARIYPTTPPTDVTDVWPITHWLFNDTDCVFNPGSPCTFWDSNAPPGGSFKEVVDFSRYSELAKANKPSIQRPQLLGQLTSNAWSRVLSGQDLFCPFGSAIPCYDPANNGGNNGKLSDVPYWVSHGWHGHLHVDELDSNCANTTKIIANCQNSRLELYNGDMGNNISSSMLSYINAFNEGIDPSCNCKFATLVAFFWRYGEQGIQETCPSPPGTCSVDRGTVWGASANPAKESTAALQRIILQKARRFRFNTSTVSSSTVRGYYVSFYSTNPPINGVPSSIADTVGLVD